LNLKTFETYMISNSKFKIKALKTFFYLKNHVFNKLKKSQYLLKNIKKHLKYLYYPSEFHIENQKLVILRQSMTFFKTSEKITITKP